MILTLGLTVFLFSWTYPDHILAKQDSCHEDGYAVKGEFWNKRKASLSEHAFYNKIFELFLFVVSEVSTGRRCLSLALFFILL